MYHIKHYSFVYNSEFLVIILPNTIIWFLNLVHHLMFRKEKWGFGIWSCFYPQFQNLRDSDPVRCFRQSLPQSQDLLNWGRKHQFVKHCVLVRLLNDGHNPEKKKTSRYDVKVWNVDQCLTSGSPQRYINIPEQHEAPFSHYFATNRLQYSISLYHHQNPLGLIAAPLS